MMADVTPFHLAIVIRLYWTINVYTTQSTSTYDSLIMICDLYLSTYHQRLLSSSNLSIRLYYYIFKPSMKYLLNLPLTVMLIFLYLGSRVSLFYPTLLNTYTGVKPNNLLFPLPIILVLHSCLSFLEVKVPSLCIWLEPSISSTLPSVCFYKICILSVPVCFP